MNIFDFIVKEGDMSRAYARARNMRLMPIATCAPLDQAGHAPHLDRMNGGNACFRCSTCGLALTEMFEYAAHAFPNQTWDLHQAVEGLRLQETQKRVAKFGPWLNSKPMLMAWDLVTAADGSVSKVINAVDPEELRSKTKPKVELSVPKDAYGFPVLKTPEKERKK